MLCIWSRSLSRSGKPSTYALPPSPSRPPYVSAGELALYGLIAVGLLLEAAGQAKSGFRLVLAGKPDQEA
jgi:hypothetical protein